SRSRPRSPRRRERRFGVTLKPITLPDLPAFYERSEEQFRKVVMAEAVTMARYDDSLTVERWRAWAEALVSAIAWTSDERRQAFADKLTAIAQEAQRVREEARAGGGA